MPVSAGTLSTAGTTYRRKEIFLVNNQYTLVDIDFQTFETSLSRCYTIALGFSPKTLQNSQDRRRIMYAAGAARRVFPLRVFLLAVLADGLEVSQMCMQGNQCPTGRNRLSAESMAGT
jgi:hypothetical protein